LPSRRTRKPSPSASVASGCTLPWFGSAIDHLAMRLAIDRPVVSHGNPARWVFADRLMNQRPPARAIPDTPEVYPAGSVGNPSTER